MIKKLLLIILLISITSCSSVKKTQEAINYGNYDEAINIALKQLRNNKTKKGNQDYVVLLEEAFEKVTIKDTEFITFLERDGNPANFEGIYNTYLNLKNRQQLIKPLLPLPIHSKSRNAKFSFKDYTNAILNSKNFEDFDNAVTAPLFGFKNAKDYWAQCSSKQFIPSIKTPTLVINAKDDSFLSKLA